MPRVFLTRRLADIAGVEAIDVAGDSLQAAFEDLFARHPRLRGYVLDDQSRIRRHVAVFVDGRRATLEDGDPRLGDGSEVHILPALSGGL